MVRERIVLLGVAAVVVVGLPALPAAASLPTGTTPVAVTAGTVSKGINARLHHAFSISGTVTLKGGGSAPGAEVDAYVGNQAVGFTTTDSAGQYTLAGLDNGSYSVCVTTDHVAPTSQTGYQPQCYGQVYFDRTSGPSGATPVTIASTSAFNVDVNLPLGGGIKGKVTAHNGTVLPNVSVFALDRSSGQTFNESTDTTGTYIIRNLPASAHGYTVCFDPSGVPPLGFGFRPRCYLDQGWDGGPTFPSTATAVSVTPGSQTTGISQVLPPGAAVAGTVIDAVTNSPVQHGRVDVFDATGVELATAPTDMNGHYEVRGLRTSTTDLVCFEPKTLNATMQYDGLCWKTVPWDGKTSDVPTNATHVSVQTGTVRTGVKFRVHTSTAFGTIAVTVTEAAGGKALSSAQVLLFDSIGGQTAPLTTDSSGHVTLSALRPGAWVVCVSAPNAASITPRPQTGWSPMCAPAAAWLGAGPPPSAATPVQVVAGQNVTVSLALPVGGAIAGTVGLFQAHGGVPGATVKIFTPSGQVVARSTASNGGSYQVSGLPPSSYIVCFDGRAQGLLPQCFKNVAWDGTS
jgi:hypothetical protein